MSDENESVEGSTREYRKGTVNDIDRPAGIESRTDKQTEREIEGDNESAA
jgi:hypothetical protein